VVRNQELLGPCRYLARYMELLICLGRLELRSSKSKEKTRGQLQTFSNGSQEKISVLWASIVCDKLTSFL
jgi:hypothetical protein